MKKFFYLMATLLLLPLGVAAQDDVYFTPKKQKKEKNITVKTEKAQEKVTEYKTYDKDDVIFNGDGIEISYPDSLRLGDVDQANDTLYIDEYETFSDGYGEWVNGFKGGVNDYKWAMQNMNWRTMRSAIPVGSSAYWNIVYGPGSFDWNVYRVGGLAYLFPTWSNPMYWDYSINLTWGSWGWGSPWRHSWFGPSYAWYDPFFYDPFYYDPFYFGGGFWGSHYAFGGWGYHWGGWHPGVSRPFARYEIGSRGYRMGSNIASRSRQDVGSRGNSGSRSDVGRRNTSGTRTSYGTRSTDTHRIQDRASSRSSRVTGRSVNSGAATRSANSLRLRENGATTANGEGSAVTRSQATRSTSSYSRSADGRNSTYTRPSSTRATENRSAVNRGTNAVRSSSATRSMESRSAAPSRNIGTSTRSSESFGGSRSSGSFGGSHSSSGSFGGGSRSSGSMGGGSRGGGRR